LVPFSSDSDCLPKRQSILLNQSIRPNGQVVFHMLDALGLILMMYPPLASTCILALHRGD
jgi:hypothetical protein